MFLYDSIFRGINEFLMPLFWFDQSAHLSPELAKKARVSFTCFFALNI